MKKFGLGKKDKSDKTPDLAPPTGSAVEESSRSRLFGSRNKTKPAPPAPANSNPYAVSNNASAGGNPYANAPAAAPGSNPYAAGGQAYGNNLSNVNSQRSAQQDPYLQNSRGASSTQYGGYGAPSNRNGYGYGDQDSRPQSSATQPPAYDSSNYNTNGSNYRNEKSQHQVQSSGYGGYGNPGDYGNPRGYGSDRYSEASSIATTRPGGYGGYGRNDSRETLETDAGKAALFGNARERLQQKQAETQLPPEEDPAQGGGYGGSGYGAESQGYGGHYDGQLTAEEQEEADVAATKSQIKDIKREDVSLLRNGLRIAQQAEETGRATLERLGMQGEMIHTAEKNLDLSANQNRIAEEKRKEIVRLNRSMFIPAAGNPFTKGRRTREADAAVLEQHHKDKQIREATRAAAYESLERQNDNQRRLRSAWEESHNPNTPALSAQIQAKKGQSLKERSKYQFEADSEDEEMENEIDASLDQLAGAAGRLHILGKAIGTELESQNRHIERIAGKVDSADDELEMLRAKLARIN